MPGVSRCVLPSLSDSSRKISRKLLCKGGRKRPLFYVLLHTWGTEWKDNNRSRFIPPFLEKRIRSQSAREQIAYQSHNPTTGACYFLIPGWLPIPPVPPHLEMHRSPLTWEHGEISSCSPLGLPSAFTVSRQCAMKPDDPTLIFRISPDPFFSPWSNSSEAARSYARWPVVAILCIRPLPSSTPMWSFMPKWYCFALLHLVIMLLCAVLR